MKVVALLVLALAAFTPLAVWADDSLVRFEGGVGVHPVSNVSGTAIADGIFPNVTRNIVRGVNAPYSGNARRAVMQPATVIAMAMTRTRAGITAAAPCDARRPTPRAGSRAMAFAPIPCPSRW
jgi:hypothetical protein